MKRYKKHIAIIFIFVSFILILPTLVFAQVMESKKTTRVGTPIGEIDPNTVAQMIQLINSNPACAQSINQSNASLCFSTISSLENSARAIAEFNRSLSQSFVLQCVGFVDGAVGLLGFPQLPPQTYAYQYARSFLPNYRFIPRGSEALQAGDILIWNPNPGSSAGHIAYTINVLPNNEFILADGNYCLPACGKIQMRKGTLLDQYLSGWLRKL